jgi:hypothetical protein
VPVLKGFKEFMLRGNIIDLAVAVVIGSASSHSSRPSPKPSSTRCWRGSAAPPWALV